MAEYGFPMSIGAIRLDAIRCLRPPLMRAFVLDQPRNGVVSRGVLLLRWVPVLIQCLFTAVQAIPGELSGILEVDA